MKCFRWRIADKCGEDDSLKCSLRHRPNQDQEIRTNPYATEAYFFSPGYTRIKPGYSNENFCLYNISLDCPDNLVDIIPHGPTTTQLSDGETCTDYLSFHVNDQRLPVTKLCGDKIADRSLYRPISSSSFYVVLFSDNNKQQRGKFHLRAKCTIGGSDGSGSGIL